MKILEKQQKVGVGAIPPMNFFVILAHFLLLATNVQVESNSLIKRFFFFLFPDAIVWEIRWKVLVHICKYI